MPPVAVVLVTGALMWLVARATPAFAFALPARRPVALVCALAGLALATSGIASFRRARTTVDPRMPASASSLVHSGLYRWTRNPMYAGMALVLLGWALFLANGLALALVPAFLVYMTRFQIQPEERALTSVFGQDYVAYTSRVRRWL